jgi:hypothetical protein
MLSAVLFPTHWRQLLFNRTHFSCAAGKLVAWREAMIFEEVK